MGRIIMAPLEKGARHNNPRMIVVHAMGEYILYPKAVHATHFLSKIGLSAHALVAPNGDTYVCRDDDQGAYHAKGYNTNSLGIEFLVSGQHNYESFVKAIKTDWVTPAQWIFGVKAVKSWVQAYDIPREKVLRHSDISPVRKVDPGEGFNWEHFLDTVFLD